MSGFLNAGPVGTHTVVRCSGISEDGRCGREQLIDADEKGVGVCGETPVPKKTAEWLFSFGWRCVDGRWLCPFCAGGLP